jgi:hypothetical protein
MSELAVRLAPDVTPVFRGLPPHLVADIEMHNPSDRCLRAGSLVARLPGDERSYVVRIPGRVAPAAKARLRAHLTVDRSMLPGEYHASMRTQEGDRPIELRVFERPAIAAIPWTLGFVGAEGDSVEGSVFLENRGNIAYAIHPHNYVFFEEVDWLGRALVFALREAAPDEGYQKYLDRLLRELRTTMVHKAKADISADEDVLRPGSVVEARISLTLPAGLHKGRNYAAFFDIAGTRLRLELACTGSAISTVRRPR